MNFPITSAVYLAALIIELFANLTQNARIQYFSKPSLMIILLFYFVVNTRKISSKLKFPVIAALCFSWLGDVLLLLDKQFKSFFIFGLIAFLAAHIFYIFHFRQIRRANEIEKFPNPLILFLIAVYSLTLFLCIAPHIENLLIPVGIYALVLSMMLGASLAAFDFKKQNFGRICFAGTLLFVVSDSILAINRFAAPFAFAPILIMLTYAAAQFLITEGSLRNLNILATENTEDTENY